MVEECRINNHLQGGIVLEGTKKNIVMISKCKFYGNKVFHIEITGFMNRALIEDNYFQGDSTSTGIKIGVGTKPRIFNNQIRDMEYGLELVSCDAVVVKNQISGCVDGIWSQTFSGFINESRLKLNEISDNEDNGIRVTGEKNFTVVVQNVSICKNKKAGVRVEVQAKAKIRKNRIYDNADQGILIVENSNAFVEGNAIFHNIKANIALGGDRSQNSVIVGNRLYKSSSEGIFVMLAGRCIIYNNQIYGNYDGIVILEAVPEISFNCIYENKNNGLHVLRGSLPVMRSNEVYGNEGVGMILRHKSLGVIEQNQIVDNELELAIEYRTPGMRKILEKNEINGEYRLPAKDFCALI